MWTCKKKKDYFIKNNRNAFIKNEIRLNKTIYVRVYDKALTIEITIFIVKIFAYKSKR
jgi:hypothetical protein